MVKLGLITAAFSVVAILASIPFGFGPCGPSSIPGAILFYFGGLDLVVGCGMIGLGLILDLIRHVRRES